MKSKLFLGLVFIFIVFSCDNPADSKKEDETKISKAIFTGNYYLETHWKADDGINENNNWYKLTFTDSTSLSEEANGSFIYAYKYKAYTNLGGWSYSDKWDGWSHRVYLYAGNDKGQLKTCILQTGSENWSEWSNYTLVDNSLTMTIDGNERTYTHEE